MAYTLKQIEDLLVYLVKNNRFLCERGKMPTSLEIVGSSGIGKTSLVGQVCQKLDIYFVKQNLAQLDDLAELIGFPIREFEMENGEWINEKSLEQIEGSVCLTGETRTSSCPPKWVPRDAERGGILMLDDYTRAQPRFIQATMELISTGEYAGWKLPPNWTIVLTTNPDDGDYFVTQLDQAQKTRFISVEAKANAKEWAEWAEMDGVDTRCINFVLMNEELITKGTNPRIITEFFNSISSLRNFHATDSLHRIQMLGEGSVQKDFTNLFVMFINNNLDRLPTPRYMLTDKDTDSVLRAIHAAVGDDGPNYKNSIASLLAQRIINFTKFLIKEGNGRLKKTVVERVGEILKCDHFNKDVKLFLTKELATLPQLNTILLDSEIACNV